MPLRSYCQSHAIDREKEANPETIKSGTLSKSFRKKGLIFIRNVPLIDPKCHG